MIGLISVESKGVDLAREDRVRKYDTIVQILVKVYKGGRLKKLMHKDGECGQLAALVVKELKEIFAKVFPEGG